MEEHSWFFKDCEKHGLITLERERQIIYICVRDKAQNMWNEQFDSSQI